MGRRSRSEQLRLALVEGWYASTKAAVQSAAVAQPCRLRARRVGDQPIDARVGYHSVSGGTRSSSWDTRAGMSRCTVSHTLPKLTSKSACTRRCRKPMILGRGMSRCASCASALNQDAASPTIPTAFRITSCVIWSPSNSANVRPEPNSSASRAASSMSSRQASSGRIDRLGRIENSLSADVVSASLNRRAFDHIYVAAE